MNPFDPMSELRWTRVTDASLEGRQFHMVLGYDELRQVARDWQTFTSAVPFMITVVSEAHLRDVRQLPIETDPPDHTEYRALVAKPFSRARADQIEPAVRAFVIDLVDRAVAGAEVEVVRDLALPIQSFALCSMLGRPIEEVDEFISWGTHVYHDTLEGPGRLDTYLRRVVAEARRLSGDDFFSTLASVEFRGRPLSDEEILGFGHLTFAGGRDTVIGTIACAIWHLARTPADLARLRAEPELARIAVEEVIRFFVPVSMLGRVATSDTSVGGCPIAEGETVAINFASANRDDAAFDRANEFVIDRSPNRHVGFGHGPHTCLGAPLARMILRVMLEELARRVRSVHIVAVEPAMQDLGLVERQVGFDSLIVRLSGTHPMA